MKRIISTILVLLGLLTGCGTNPEPAQIAATTLPVYEFTSRLCAGTDITVCRLITESVSCLHDYTLNVSQVRAAEAAELIVINGAGLEEFMEDLFHDKELLNSSDGMVLMECEEETDHDHNHHGHHHEVDSHIWLSPENAKLMAENICTGLCVRYPKYADIFQTNLQILLVDMDALQAYGEAELSTLACQELITFHDGFSYLANSFGLTILEAVEEESGSEASAAELKHLIELTREHHLPAIFIETNGSDSAASVIARETGVVTYTLDMAMAGNSWFDAMYHNIDTIKEALG